MVDIDVVFGLFIVMDSAFFIVIFTLNGEFFDLVNIGVNVHRLDSFVVRMELILGFDDDVFSIRITFVLFSGQLILTDFVVHLLIQIIIML